MEPVLHRWVFPGTLAVSVLMHGCVLMCFWAVAEELPVPVTPEIGKNSILVRVSEAARPKPTEETLEKLLADLPLLPELTRPKHLVPDPAAKKIEAVARPPAFIQPVAELRAETKVIEPSELPPLDPLPPLKIPDAKTVLPPLKTAKDGPLSLPRPVPKEVIPSFEPVTKIAEMTPVTPEASDRTQGALPDELPRKLAVNPSPPYPAEALQSGQEGKVVLRLRIDSTGKVTAISVNSSSGVRSLDDSALSTVRNWVFTPARRGGQTMSYEVLQPVEFSIRRPF